MGRWTHGIYGPHGIHGPTADTARQRCECWGAVLLHGTGQQLEYLNNRSLKETVTEMSSVSVIPSGKLSHNYGKSSFLMGKSTISMAIFNSYFDITRESAAWQRKSFNSETNHGDSSTKPTPMAIPAPASKPQRERVGFNMRQPS